MVQSIEQTVLQVMFQTYQYNVSMYIQYIIYLLVNTFWQYKYTLIWPSLQNCQTWLAFSQIAIKQCKYLTVLYCRKLLRILYTGWYKKILNTDTSKNILIPKNNSPKLNQVFLNHPVWFILVHVTRFLWNNFFIIYHAFLLA